MPLVSLCLVQTSPTALARQACVLMLTITDLTFGILAVDVIGLEEVMVELV